MSVRSDAAVCRSCGRVDLATEMVRVADQEHAYACIACAKPTRRKAR